MIDINKKYRTRDGREVRIYATDGVGCAAVHGAIYQPTGCNTVSSNQPGMEWCVTVWHISGQHVKSEFDLIEVKPRVKKTMWLSLYPNGVVWFCTENSKVGDDCLARVKVEIDCEQGEGL